MSNVANRRAREVESRFGAVTTIWVSGGRSGTYPRITCRVVTSGGRTIDQTVQLPVADR